MRHAIATGESTAPYRGRLLARRGEIVRNFGPRLDSSFKAEPLAEDDQASLSHDEFVIVSLNGLDYIQLRLIDEALDRIASGDYGICPNCGNPIPSKRLDALPWARYCVPCQEEVGAREEAAIAGAYPRLPVLRPPLPR